MTQPDIPLISWGVVPDSPTVQHAADNPGETPTTPPRPKRDPRRAIVFIHGIFSSHRTFEATKALMQQNNLLTGVEFHYFDYPFNDSMEMNGVWLAQALRAAGFEAGDHVALVAHSMGGLVSRFAILSETLEFVRILFLLGTPNAGAMRLSQLSLLAQLAHIGTRSAFALFSRRSGIAGLSNAAALIEAHRQEFTNAVEIDYVSVPGRFFHEDRSYWELPRRLDGAAFSILEGALLRTAFIHMKRPHDGIVEDSSNNLAQCPRGTEKEDSYGGHRGKRRATYGHLSLAVCADLNHMEIHSDHIIVDVISELISHKFAAAKTSDAVLENWYKNLSPKIRLDYGVRMSFDG